MIYVIGELKGLAPKGHLSSLNTEENGQEPQLELGIFNAAGPENEKTCRGRRCGRLSEKNRTTAYEEECRCSDRRPLGGGVGRLKHEALREEVHRFDETKIPILSAH
jgi:hypothetical protein